MSKDDSPSYVLCRILRHPVNRKLSLYLHILVSTLSYYLNCELAVFDLHDTSLSCRTSQPGAIEAYSLMHASRKCFFELEKLPHTNSAQCYCSNFLRICHLLQRISTTKCVSSVRYEKHHSKQIEFRFLHITRILCEKYKTRLIFLQGLPSPITGCALEHVVAKITSPEISYQTDRYILPRSTGRIINKLALLTTLLGVLTVILEYIFQKVKPPRKILFAKLNTCNSQKL